MSIFSFDDQLKTIETLWGELDSKITQAQEKSADKFDFTQPLPGFRLAHRDVTARFQTLLAFVRGLEGADDMLIPSSFSSGMSSALDQLQGALNDAVSTMGKLEGDVKVDVEQGTFTGKETVRLADMYREINSGIDAGIESFCRIRQIIGSRGLGNFMPQAKRLSQELFDLQQGKASLESTQQEVKSMVGEIERVHQLVDTRLHNIEKSEEDINSVVAKVHETESKLALLDGLAKRTSDVDETIREYEIRFETLDSEIEERKKRADENAARIQQMLDQEETVKNLLQSARAMMGYAKGVGLARPFLSTREELRKETRNAEGLFVLAIALLFATSFGVVKDMAMVIDGAQTLGAKEWFSLLVRGLMLVPFIWFAYYQNKKARSLDALRHHYEFKATVATAVDSFREQTEFKEEVLMNAFDRVISTNPARIFEKFDHGDADRPFVEGEEVVETAPSKKPQSFSFSQANGKDTGDNTSGKPKATVSGTVSVN